MAKIQASGGERAVAVCIRYFESIRCEKPIQLGDDETIGQKNHKGR
jgi:hypothetical protein